MMNDIKKVILVQVFYSFNFSAACGEPLHSMNHPLSLVFMRSPKFSVSFPPLLPREKIGFILNIFLGVNNVDFKKSLEKPKPPFFLAAKKRPNG